MTESICIISPHVKGFWQADVYLDGWEEGVLPDWFRTGKIGGTKEQMEAEIIKGCWSGISFIDGITGICTECGEEYFNLERQCDCGGLIED